MTIQSLSQLVMMMLVMARMLRLFVSSPQTATTMCRYRPFILKEENLNFQSPHGDTLKEENLNFHDDTSFLNVFMLEYVRSTRNSIDPIAGNIGFLLSQSLIAYNNYYMGQSLNLDPRQYLRQNCARDEHIDFREVPSGFSAVGFLIYLRVEYVRREW